jgi:ferredoxin-NADP reductase
VLQLKAKKRVAPDIVDFVLAPSQRLVFEPGQYMEVTLGHAPADTRGNRRYFTLASSPTEAAVRLGIRFYPDGSTFKRALYALDGRTPLLGGQIAGDFTMPRDPSKKLLFIAGGIGITPYRSMLKYLLDTGQARDIIVLYAAHSADEIIYRDVLNAAQEKFGTRTICTLTDPAAVPRDWSGIIGRVDAAMLRAAVPDLPERTCYISGPPEMVRASEQALRHLGVQRRHIKKDFFPGLA